MNTNPGSGVDGKLFSPYLFRVIGNFFSNISKSIKNNHLLDDSMRTGAFGIPYATMGLVTFVAGTFTYVTYVDYTDDPGDEDEDEDEDEDGKGGLGNFMSLGANSDDDEDDEKKPEEDDEKKPEDDEKKIEEDDEKKSVEDDEKKPEEEEDDDKTKPEAPGEKYTMGGKTHKRRKKYLKKKTTQRRIRK